MFTTPGSAATTASLEASASPARTAVKVAEAPSAIAILSSERIRPLPTLSLAETDKDGAAVPTDKIMAAAMTALIIFLKNLFM